MSETASETLRRRKAAAEVRAKKQSGPYSDRSFYGSLLPWERMLLDQDGTFRQYRSGYSITMENRLSSRVLILLRGLAKGTAVTAEGEEVVLRIYGPGDIFGVEAVLASQPRSETVIALGGCAALAIPAPQFTRLLDTPGIARALSLAMLHRVQASDDQVKLRHATADARLAHVLLNLAARGGTEARDGFTIPADLTQEDLASLLGLSRSTVARALHSLRRLEMIRTGYRNITITDAAGLRRISQRP